MTFTPDQIEHLKRLIRAEVNVLAAPTPYDIRLKAGWQKVSSLAKRAGVHADLVRKYERGQLQSVYDQTYQNFKLLAVACGVTTEEYSSAVNRQMDRVRNAR